MRRFIKFLRALCSEARLCWDLARERRAKKRHQQATREALRVVNGGRR